jgi:hypothetical protein
MTKIKITWKAFGDKPERGRFISSVEVELAKQVSDDFRICEAIYKVTNLQGELAEFGASLAEINLWETIESKLSPTRTHTSLSIGDEVEIDGRAYVCADLGFIKVSEAEIRTFPDGAVWSILKKAEVSA